MDWESPAVKFCGLLFHVYLTICHSVCLDVKELNLLHDGEAQRMPTLAPEGQADELSLRRGVSVLHCQMSCFSLPALPTPGEPRSLLMAQTTLGN